MNEEEITKLIKSKTQAIEENLLLSTELTEIKEKIEPKFRDPSTMTYEQLHDPDYHIKQLAKLSNGKLTVTCSKCHHCR